MQEIQHLLSGTGLEPSFDYDDFEADRIKRQNEQEGALTGYDCRICKNKGYIYTLSEGYETAKECKCMALRSSMYRAEKSGLGDMLLHCTFKSFKTSEAWQKPILKAAQDYVTNGEGKWFYIGGQVGCGKTHLCAAIAGELLKKGKSVRYMLWRDEAVTLKAVVTDDEAYSRIINEIKRAQVLYIDDFFKTQQNTELKAADINLAFEIINYRYNNKKLRTIFSSELLIREVLERDEAIGSRIYEMTREYCLKVGKDPKKNYRLKPQ